MKTYKANGRKRPRFVICRGHRRRMSQTRWVFASCTLGVTILFWGCSDQSELPSTNPSTSPVDVSASADDVVMQDGDPLVEPRVDSLDLNNDEVFRAPGVLELSGFKLLQAVGAVDFVETYIANLPASAQFLTFWEVARIGTAVNHLHDDKGTSGAVLADFENGLIRAAKWAGGSLPHTDGSQALHEAFFGAMAECGRGSAWPDIEPFVMHEGIAGEMPDVMIEPKFGLSYLEFVELRHECARYAATYPTLEPAVRDELLAPQRAHHANAILDWIDNSLPVVEVPPEYQDEIAELRANGW